MDRLVYVAMSGAKETLRAPGCQQPQPGERQYDWLSGRPVGVPDAAGRGAGLPSRAYATNSSVGWDASSGALAAHRPQPGCRGQGSAAGSRCRPADGTEAYTRAGDLHVDANGALVTATGLQVLGDSGPITVAPVFDSINDRLRRLGLDRAGWARRPSTVASGGAHQAGQSAERTNCARGHRRPVPLDSGEYRAPGCRREAWSPARSNRSNVNIAEAMANMIELARQLRRAGQGDEDGRGQRPLGTKLLQTQLIRNTGKATL